MKSPLSYLPAVKKRRLIKKPDRIITKYMVGKEYLILQCNKNEILKHRS